MLFLSCDLEVKLIFFPCLENKLLRVRQHVFTQLIYIMNFIITNRKICIFFGIKTVIEITLKF